MNSYALVSIATGKVQTFLRPDLPDGYAPPEGYQLVADDQLPAGWQREESTQNYIELREAAYLAEGVTPDALAIALAEKDGEGKPEAFNALQAKRAAIKLRYPKPV